MSRVSICVPTYNGRQYIAQAIDSILRQTHADFELIISDDCSTDGTREVVTSFKDPRLRLSVNSQRLGLVGNWNRCISLASEGYIYIFHQDDIMHPDAVGLLTSTMERHPEVGFVFSTITTIDDMGTAIGGHWLPYLPDNDTVFLGRDFFRLLLTKGNLVPCQTVLMRSQCIRDAGWFDPRLHYTPDLEMWLRLSLRYDVAFRSQPLVSLRRHSHQESCGFLGKAQEIDEVWSAFQIVFSEQNDLIAEPESLYTLGLTHLADWSYSQFRYSLRQLRLGLALSYWQRWLSFRQARHRGLADEGTASHGSRH